MWYIQNNFILWKSMKNIESMKNNFADFMISMWLDLDDASLKDTPNRVAKMYANEICRWLYDEPPKITTFPNEWKNMYDGIVLVRDIKLQSLCEHHFQPFIWKCHIAYIPDKRVVWLSKFARVVDYFARKPQVQERLTMEIYNFLVKTLETEDIAVFISSEHFCMKLRGVQDPCSSTSTSKLWGRFFDDQKAREEFYHLLS